MSEIITVAECLKRIGLEDLMVEGDGGYTNSFVEWNGYPKPFACGHTGVYGFGPLKKDCGYPEVVENDHRGSGRLYQERVRVNQHSCSGDVLFSFPSYAKDFRGDFYRINSSMVISIDTIPDYKSTCLKLCFTA